MDFESEDDFHARVEKMVTALRDADLDIKDLSDLLMEVNKLNQERTRRLEIGVSGEEHEAIEQWYQTERDSILARVLPGIPW